MEISYVLLQEGGCNAAESVILPRAVEMLLQEVVSHFYFYFFLRREDYLRIFEHVINIQMMVLSCLLGQK